jgi:hypothetical protein
MKLTTLLIATGICGITAAQDGWKKPESLQVTAVERYADGRSREATIAAYDGKVAVKSTLGVNGALEGMPRIESYTSAGIHTWLESRPQYAMRLPIATDWGVFEFIARPRFSRADLEFNLKGIESALGKKVQVGKEEKVAGRDCLVLIVLDTPDSGGSDFQKLWIDRQTGLTMRLQDYFRGAQTYEREITSLYFGSDAPPLQMSPSESALVIKGAVSAETLLRLPAPRAHTDLRDDIAKVNASRQAPSSTWAQSINVGGGIGYAQTNYHEMFLPATRRPAPQADPRQRANQFADMAILQEFREAAVQREATIRLSGGSGGQSGEYQIRAESGGQRREFVVQRNEDGSVVVTQGGSWMPAGSGGGASSEDSKDRTVFIAKSDFVDPKTGETLTLVQAHGTSALGQLGPLVLGQPTAINDPRLPEAHLFTVQSPWRLVVLTWRKADVRYALAGTALTEAQLKDIAAQIK